MTLPPKLQDWLTETKAICEKPGDLAEYIDFDYGNGDVYLAGFMPKNEYQYFVHSRTALPLALQVIEKLLAMLENACTCQYKNAGWCARCKVLAEVEELLAKGE